MKDGVMLLFTPLHLACSKMQIRFIGFETSVISTYPSSIVPIHQNVTDVRLVGLQMERTGFTKMIVGLYGSSMWVWVDDIKTDVSGYSIHHGWSSGYRIEIDGYGIA